MLLLANTALLLGPASSKIEEIDKVLMDCTITGSLQQQLYFACSICQVLLAYQRDVYHQYMPWIGIWLVRTIV
jgi:hypothetical protein